MSGLLFGKVVRDAVIVYTLVDNDVDFYNNLLPLLEGIDKLDKCEYTKVDEEKSILLGAEHYEILIVLTDEPIMSISIPEVITEDFKKVEHRIINSLNIIFSEYVSSVKIGTICKREIDTPIEYANKIFSGTQLLKLNECIGRNVNPLILGFDYQNEDKSYLVIMSELGETLDIIIASRNIYESILSFNIVDKLYDELKSEMEHVLELIQERYEDES